MNNKRRGVRLTRPPAEEILPEENELPLYGRIAAGQPIEAIAGNETITVPPPLRTENPCYVLEVKGDSMIEEGILDGDWVVIEQRDHARNGEIVVALVNGEEATLKRIEQKQGLVGQMRRYH